MFGFGIKPSVWRHILWVASVVSVVSFVYFYPYATGFRFTLGVAILTLLLLHFEDTPIFLTTVLTGTTILFCRHIVGYIEVPEYNWAIGWLKLYPAFIYYVIFGILMAGINIRRYQDNPIALIFIITLIDVISNIGEFSVRHEWQKVTTETAITTLLGIAFLRSVLAYTLFWLLRRQKILVLQGAHQKRYIELNILIANLNAELFYLKKSTQDIENVMQKSYILYENMLRIPAMDEALREQTLHVAKDIHEVKKDYQRVISGLEKILPASDNLKVMNISEIFYVIQENTRSLLAALQKEITFTVHFQDDFPTRFHYAVVSMLNNLIINSIEATHDGGYIRVEQYATAEYIVFQVEDDGEGIKERDLHAIFEPGFSTKVDKKSGKLSTGLGLTHVSFLVRSLGGEIAVKSFPGKKTTFSIWLPRQSIILPKQEGE
jgi:two-component system, sensor histidine kinase YcbA